MKPLNCLVICALLLFQVGCSGDGSTAPSEDATSQNEEQSVAPESESIETEVEQAIEKIAEKPAEQSDSPGLAIGEKAPEFELKDQNGKSQSLTDILGSGHAALVFYRSADW